MRCLPIVLPSLYGSSPSRRPACRPTHPLRAPLTHLPRISHAGLPIANASSSLYLALLDDDGSSSLGSLDDDDPVGAHMAWAWCMEHGMVHGPCGQGMVHGLWHGAWVMWYGHGAWAWCMFTDIGVGTHASWAAPVHERRVPLCAQGDWSFSRAAFGRTASSTPGGPSLTSRVGGRRRESVDRCASGCVSRGSMRACSSRSLHALCSTARG